MDSGDRNGGNGKAKVVILATSNGMQCASIPIQFSSAPHKNNNNSIARIAIGHGHGERNGYLCSCSRTCGLLRAERQKNNSPRFLLPEANGSVSCVLRCNLLFMPWYPLFFYYILTGCNVIKVLIWVTVTVFQV